MMLCMCLPGELRAIGLFQECDLSKADDVTNVGLAWMSSGQVWMTKMQRFEETKCCVVDGRDHVLKGLAVFGVSHDCVHLQRWGTKEV